MSRGLVGTAALAVWLVTACSSSGTAADAGATDAAAGADTGPDATDGPSSGDADAAPVDATGDADAASDAGIPDANEASPDAGDASDAAMADASDASDAATYTNPVLNADFPDPFILRQGTTYYAFATNAGSAHVQAARSSDLAHWTHLGDALPTLPAWAAGTSGLTWAPSVLEVGAGHFVMYYATRDAASGFQCISRAVATNPAGPYVDSSASAFVCQVSGAQSFCGSIDPSPMVDVDGTAYLVWKSDENSPSCGRPPRLWSAALSADGLSLAGPPNELLAQDASWQQGIMEGPSMRLVGGTYFLVYSANAYESAAYAMGYARCLSATGPCVDVTTAGPFVSSAGTALGPGGGEFFDDAAGRLWMVYHAWTAPLTTYSGGGARSMRIDRLDVTDGGILALEGPTTTAQPL